MHHEPTEYIYNRRYVCHLAYKMFRLNVLRKFNWNSRMRVGVFTFQYSFAFISLSSRAAVLILTESTSLPTGKSKIDIPHANFVHILPCIHLTIFLKFNLPKHTQGSGESVGTAGNGDFDKFIGYLALWKYRKLFNLVLGGALC